MNREMDIPRVPPLPTWLSLVSGLLRDLAQQFQVDTRDLRQPCIQQPMWGGCKQSRLALSKRYMKVGCANKADPMNCIHALELTVENVRLNVTQNKQTNKQTNKRLLAALVYL